MRLIIATSTRRILACTITVLAILVAAGPAASRGGETVKVTPQKAVSIRREIAADAAEIHAAIRAASRATAKERKALTSHLQSQAWYTKLVADIKKLDGRQPTQRTRARRLQRAAHTAYKAAYRAHAPALSAKGARAAKKHVRGGGVRPTPLGGLEITGATSSGSGTSSGSSGAAGTSAAHKSLGSWSLLTSFATEGWELTKEGGAGTASHPSEGNWHLVAWARSGQPDVLTSASAWGVGKVQVPAGYATLQIRAKVAFYRHCHADQVWDGGYSWAAVKARLKVTRGGNDWWVAVDSKTAAVYSHGVIDHPLGTASAPAHKTVDMTIDVSPTGGAYVVRFGAVATAQDSNIVNALGGWGDSEIHLRVTDIKIDVHK